MSAKTYKYEAQNEKSYSSLVAFAVTLPVTVTLFPKLQTIVIPEEAADEIGEFIDSECLDFIINTMRFEVGEEEELLSDPTADTTILREIAEAFQDTAKKWKEALSAVNTEKGKIEDLLAKASEDKARYAKWMNEDRTKSNRVIEQVKAISVLIESIANTN